MFGRVTSLDRGDGTYIEIDMRLSKIKIFIYLPTTPTNYLSTIPDSMVQRSPPFGNLFSDYLKLGSREIVYFGGIGVVGKISAVLTVTFFSI